MTNAQAALRAAAQASITPPIGNLLDIGADALAALDDLHTLLCVSDGEEPAALLAQIAERLDRHFGHAQAQLDALPK